ncbi:MAG: type II secretion system protein [Phycisphaerae bacterium]|nr:type II secretion system protein [Phycisphaerae bacterium]
MRLAGAAARDKSRGFTLIELMVVIAILTLLMALLMPVMRRAWAAACQVDCANNLHQVVVGVKAYAAAHEGEGPRVWSEWLGDRRDIATGTLYPYVGDRRVFRCPIKTDERESPHCGLKPPITSYFFNGQLEDDPPVLERTYKPGMFLMFEEKPIDTATGPASPCNDGADVPNFLDQISDIHFGGGNIAFPDGHVRWMSFEEYTEKYFELYSCE